MVNNDANIYFDYNLPITTNTVQITISDFVLPLSQEAFNIQHLKVYPNPTSGLLVIESDTLTKVEVYNISGSLMETTTQHQINLSHYAKGIYLVKITTPEGIALKKIVLE